MDWPCLGPPMMTKTNERNAVVVDDASFAGCAPSIRYPKTTCWTGRRVAEISTHRHESGPTKDGGHWKRQHCRTPRYRSQ